MKFSANGASCDKLAHLKRWTEMKNVSYMCSVHKGYVPGLFGVSHGALQFMAYEKLKKDFSRYFRVHQSMKNKSLASDYLHWW